MDMEELTENKYERDLKNKHFKNKLGGANLNPNIQEVEAGSWIQGQPELHTEIQTEIVSQKNLFFVSFVLNIILLFLIMCKSVYVVGIYICEWEQVPPEARAIENYNYRWLWAA